MVKRYRLGLTHAEWHSCNLLKNIPVEFVVVSLQKNKQDFRYYEVFIYADHSTPNSARFDFLPSTVRFAECS